MNRSFDLSAVRTPGTTSRKSRDASLPHVRIQDPWLHNNEAIDLNKAHIAYWKAQSPEALESDRSFYLKVLVEQDVGLKQTPVKHWLNPDCPAVVRHSSGDPVDCDVLILRPSPCKKSASHEGDTRWKDPRKPDFKTDYLTWVDALRREGLNLNERSVFTLHYSPFYFEKKSARGLGSKTSRNVLGWRFALAVWLIRPRYILASNAALSKLVRAGFDSRKYESVDQMDWNYMRSLRYKPPAFCSDRSAVTRTIRISHPYQFDPSNTKRDMKAGRRFADAVKFLIGCFAEDEEDKTKESSANMYQTLLEAALTGHHGGQLGQPANRVKDAADAHDMELSECTHPPYWLSVKDWYMFSAPKSGVCECSHCGGCGAEQSACVDNSLFAHDTLFAPRAAYHTEWIELPTAVCEWCQCRHGHRTLDFNECILGCPVGGFVTEVHSKLLSVTEQYQSVAFIAELLDDPDVFATPVVLEMLAT